MLLISYQTHRYNRIKDAIYSSRKKNKGKDRKAKKAAELEEYKKVTMYNYWTNWACGKGSKGAVIIHCNHGYGLETTIPDISHPVSIFISDCLLRNEILDTLETHIEVLSDSHRKLAIDILTHIGTNLILCKSTNVSVTVKEVAFAVMVLEKYGELHDFHSTLNSRDIASKTGNLATDLIKKTNNRDVLKFFRKRLTSLKKMHLEARKTIPKLGKCDHCIVEKERALLLVCSICMVDQYCSRKCQLAASAKHRTDCDKYVSSYERTVANTT